MKRPLLTLLALGTSSCGIFFSAPTPMRVVATPSSEPAPAKCLVIFLPGFGDDENDFAKHGFVEALQSRHIPVDTISTGATFGYYYKRTLLTRLREDVIARARAHGYEQIWTVGISMGGMGSLLLARDQKETPLAGMLLLAPYLGDDPILHEIDGAGGVEKWDPGPPRKDDYQREVWRWLKDTTTKPDAKPLIYLGAGDSDKLGYGHKLLRAELPKERVFRAPGPHDWAPWRAIWNDFLDHSDFRTRCGGS